MDATNAQTSRLCPTCGATAHPGLDPHDLKQLCPTCHGRGRVDITTNMPPGAGPAHSLARIATLAAGVLLGVLLLFGLGRWVIISFVINSNNINTNIYRRTTDCSLPRVSLPSICLTATIGTQLGSPTPNGTPTLNTTPTPTGTSNSTGTPNPTGTPTLNTTPTAGTAGSDTPTPTIAGQPTPTGTAVMAQATLTPTPTAVPPLLAVNPLSFLYSVCTLQAPQFIISNGGAGTLIWHATATGLLQSVAPTGGSLGAGGSQAVTVSNILGSGSVTVTADGALRSPQTVTITCQA